MNRFVSASSYFIGCLGWLLSVPALAQGPLLNSVRLTPSQNDFGGVGLLQTPTARMEQEGAFHLGFTRNADYYHYKVSMQLMPWLETSIRYTRVPDMRFSQYDEYSGDNLYTDKGIDFKIRLMQEEYWLPEVAVGVRDFGGTGLFDGEYLIASKAWGNLDLHLGLGWGYLGQRQQFSGLCKLSDRYCQRPTDFKGEGGSIDFERWFKGGMSLFGGLEYQTPWQPLSLKLEYEGNDYSQDFPVLRGGKSLPQHTPWNFGVRYQLNDWADVQLSYQRGDTLTLGINLGTNFNQMTSIWRDDDILPLPQATKVQPHWQQAVEDLADNAGYQQVSLSESGDTLVVRGQQTKYRDRTQAQERAAAVLAYHTPNYIKTYRIIEENKGLALTQTTISAKAYRQYANYEQPQTQFEDVVQYSEPNLMKQGDVLAVNEQQWNLGIAPVLAQSFGGPESFYLYHLGFNANGQYNLTQQLEASGSIYVNLADNYQKFNYVDRDPHINNFAVPRVRTLFRSYVHDHPVRLNHLQLTWFAQPSTDWYTQSYAGYLETMFAGVGSEVLYRPLAKPWALGVDLNLVSQRDPDSWFKTYRQPYQYYDGMTEKDCIQAQPTSCKAYVLDKGFTGHLTGYYQPQWQWLENTLVKVSIGQFLGGDKGGRVDVSKRFKSGVIVGAFATFTNLTTEEYGEGSYNKGFYLSIPFDMLTVKPSVSRAYFAWQPITRDGGQMLNRQYHLFDVTDAKNPWFN